jgi:two-component system, OmpR family, sensor histidine kinase BaeS
MSLRPSSGPSDLLLRNLRRGLEEDRGSPEPVRSWSAAGTGMALRAITHSGRSARAGGGGALSLRLGLAILSVALAGIALVAAFTAVLARGEVSDLVSRQRTVMTNGVAAAVGMAWRRNDSWTHADLSPVLAMAARAGTDVRVLGPAGRPVASAPGFAAHAAAPMDSAPVIADGRRVAEVLARFTGAGLGSADDALRADLLRAIAGAAGLAALLALPAGLAMARPIMRPVECIIAAARAVGSGQRSARVGAIKAPAALRELGMTFDEMADMLDRQEQLRRDLVADVAHELRTPIAVLQAEHEALLDGVTAPTPGHLGSLRDEVLRLARLVGDLQSLAAADAAVLHLSLQRCELATLACEAASSLAGRFDAAGLRLERRLNPVEIIADPRWLHQIITNLLTNALKYTPAGGRVTIAAARSRHEAVLTVTDTGTGIRADDLPRIFDRFWRGRDAAEISGSGIGLAVAAELTRAHGGHLTAASKPGQGTQMILTLPQA